MLPVYKLCLNWTQSQLLAGDFGSVVVPQSACVKSITLPSRFLGAEPSIKFDLGLSAATPLAQEGAFPEILLSS